MNLEVKLGGMGPEIAVGGNSRNAMYVTQHGGAFETAVNRGRVFSVASQVGITSQAGLSGTTPALTLYNRPGSGVKMVLWYAGAVFTVAFGTAGAIWLAAGTNTVAAAVTGTETTAHRNLKLGGGAPSQVPLLAATLPAAPVGIDLLGVGLTGAITVALSLSPVERWYSGGVILMPGTNISIQTGVASGTSATFCSYIWEEVDL